MRAQLFVAVAIAAGLVVLSAAAASERDSAAGCPNRAVYRTGEPENGNPRWSHDAKRLLFHSTRTGRHHVFVLDVATCAVRQVTRGARSASNPDWGPGGKRIVFQRDVGGAVVSRIFVANAAGTKVRQLTRGSGSDWFPAWAPRGNLIAFDRYTGGESAERRNVYVVRPDGKGLKRLTNSRWNLRAAWSRDGKRIAWSDGVSILVMDADGRNKRRVTNRELARVNGQTDPAWSPDGTRIAFVHGAGSFDADGIFIVDVRTGAVERLPGTRGNDGSPTWSPDGKRIAFERDSGRGSSDLYVTKVDGTDFRRLTLAPNRKPD